MSERIVNDPSQHGWVEVDGKWVWDASGSGGGAGAGMVISETEPTDKVEGMQWLNPTTGLVLFWDDEKWLQLPITGAAGKDGADGADGNIADADTQGVISTWDDTAKRWTPEGGVTYNSGTATFKTTSGNSTLFMARGDTGVRVYLQAGNAGYVGTQTDNEFSVTANAKSVLTVRPDLSAEFNGNVGIGGAPNNDDAKLWMYGPILVGDDGGKWSGFIKTEVDGSDINLVIANAGGGAGNNIVFETNAGETLRIDGANGNVIIDAMTLGGPLGRTIYASGSGGTSGLHFGSGNIQPANSSGNLSGNSIDIGASAMRFKDAHFSGNVYATNVFRDGSVLTSAKDLIETLHTLREATKDETTLEGLRDAIGNAVGGLIEKFEAMQSTATQEISDE